MLFILNVNYCTATRGYSYHPKWCRPFSRETRLLMSYDASITDHAHNGILCWDRNINERRHQLHELFIFWDESCGQWWHAVLIIKVLLYQKSESQVYFIDNDEYFKRKSNFSDEDGVLFQIMTNASFFLAKGVVET
jgi:starch synthase